VKKPCILGTLHKRSCHQVGLRGHLDHPGQLRFFRRIHALCVGLGAACVSDLPFFRTCLCYQHATIETSHENVPQIAPHPAERRESTSSASRASSTLPATAATHTPPAPRITPTRILVSRSAALPPLDRSRDANTEAPLGTGAAGERGRSGDSDESAGGCDWSGGACCGSALMMRQLPAALRRAS